MLFRKGKQRWMHYYFLNELFLAVLGLWTFRHYSLLSAFFVVTLSSVLMALSVACLLFVRCKIKNVIPVTKPRHALPQWKESEHKTRDGIKLKVQVSVGGGEKVMLIAAPLGQCGPSIFNPVFAYFGPEFTYVTWDYRGFFDSGTPQKLRRISIPEHAQDAVEILEAAGLKKADVMIGHSMGTVVALETVILYPEKVGSVIIMNGFHGQVFRTAFQLIWRIPFMGDLVAWFVDANVNNPKYIDLVYRTLLAFFRRFMPKYEYLLARSPLMKEIIGKDYLSKFMESYIGGILSTPQNLLHWLRLFQELDAHSVYHLLPTIEQPMLVISGLWDPVTPAMQSVEISRRVPHAVHYCDIYSTHATILESPELGVAEIASFLQNIEKHAAAKKND